MAHLISTTDRRSGFTLAESLIASMVLAIAVIAVATTLSASHSQSGAVEVDSRAISIARQLIEEISAKPLVLSDSTAGWPGQTDRSHYDSISDYAGYTDTTPLSMLDGHVADVARIQFTRTVTLHQPATLFGTAPAAGDFLIVEVDVRDAGGRGATLRRLVSRTTLRR